MSLNLENFEILVAKVQKQNGHNSLDREARILKSLQGVNHVQQFIFFQIYSNYSILCSKPFGIPLHILSVHKPFTIDLAMIFAAQLLSVLKYLHNQQIFHRDITPSNIIMYEHNFYLIDFGISCTSEDSKEWREKRIGTPLFMSRIAHQDPYRAEDDLEGLTFTLVFILNGFCPWEPDSEILYSSVLVLNKYNFYAKYYSLFSKIERYECDETLRNFLNEVKFVDQDQILKE